MTNDKSEKREEVIAAFEKLVPQMSDAECESLKYFADGIAFAKQYQNQKEKEPA